MSDTEPTRTRPSTSTFMGTIVIGDDLRQIKVDASGGGPEQVSIEFTLRDFTTLPHLYLTTSKARELRDLLTEALDPEPSRQAQRQAVLAKVQATS